MNTCHFVKLLSLFVNVVFSKAGVFKLKLYMYNLNEVLL